MKLKKKKKGSAFITVIVVAAILAVTGATMLTVTASDYRMRKVESEKIKNLYEADSGLNVVENIIIKASQSAIKKSDEDVKKNFASLKDEDKNTKKVDDLFKAEFYKYLNQRSEETKELTLLEYIVENKLYIDESNSEKLLFKNSNLKEAVEITIKDGDYKFTEEGIEIKVTSSFESKDQEIKSKKTLQTTFKITAPNYNSKISEVGIYSIYDAKTLTVDGNMQVEDGINNISGDIWVKGYQSEKDDIKYAFDKYEGGILLNKTTFNLIGNLYTFNSLNLKNDVVSNISKTVYANNLYVGKSSSELSSEGNNISINGDLILNNDLALNSTSSNITIKENFYGINGKKENTSNAEKAMNSSSIIVNDTLNKSKITIEKKSYIMGVAYLDATDSDGNKYQTGESVSVKGNYLAYTDVSNLEDGYVLKYYSPLQLLESKNSDSSISMKANYFKDYYDNKSNTYSLNSGGIYLNGEVYSVGASIKTDKVSTGNLNADSDAIKLVGTKQEDFALNVLAMGGSNGISNLDSLYSSNEVVRTVDDQIDFSKIKDLDKNIKINDEIGLVLIGDEKDLIIDGNTLKSDNPLLNGKIIKKGLIITNGNIKIQGNCDFEGTIITSKNLYIIGSGTRSLSYNGEIVRDVIASNEDVLKNIFKSPEINKKAEEIKIVSDTNLYDKSNFLKVAEWKIIK